MQQCDMVLGNGKCEVHGLVLCYMKNENSCFMIYEIWAGEDGQKVTSIENDDALRQNGSSSAANPTELNQNLETGLYASSTNPEPENLVM